MLEAILILLLLNLAMGGAIFIEMKNWKYVPGFGDQKVVKTQTPGTRFKAWGVKEKIKPKVNDDQSVWQREQDESRRSGPRKGE